MKKKRLLTLIGSVCMVLVLAVLSLAVACTPAPAPAPDSAPDSAPAPAPDSAPDQTSLPAVLTLATHPIGSKFNALGSGLAAVLSAHLTTEVKAMPTSGPVEWAPMLGTEEVDLGIANNADSKWAWLAQSAYEEPLQGKGAAIRLLSNGSPAINSVLVAANSGIMTGQDLKGKRYVGIFTGSPAITAQAQGALANFGLKPEDVKMITVPGVNDGVKAVMEGRADATGSAVLGMPVVKELNAKMGARFLSLDPSPEAVKRYIDYFPAVAVKMEPERVGLKGVTEAIYMMKYQTYLSGRTTLTDETAYWVVKTLWDYNSELPSIHAAFKSWTTDQFVTELATIPYHSGAIKFYKEVGAWTSKMDEVQKALLAQEK